jgi:hypothetical protein
VFGRSKEQPVVTEVAVDVPEAQQVKGRPTPTRKEAEAARKAALTGVPSDPKEAKKAARDAQRQARYDQQNALRSGDISKLPPRDAGAVRARVRDFVDSRISAGELFIPIAVVVLLLSLIRSTAVANLVLALWSITLLAVAADTAFLIWRLRRTLAAEFPDQDRSGAVTYGVMRSLQLRSLRLPKPRVRWNGQSVKPKTPKVKV